MIRPRADHELTATMTMTTTQPNPDDFGIRDGITEVIATTRSDSGVPNAAPIGIIRDGDRNRLCVRLFLGSHTRENAIASGEIVANITRDPVQYVESTFGDLDASAFDFPDGMSCPVLKDASAWILFEIERLKGNVFELAPVRGVILGTKPFAINRGFNAVIESLVHATRYQLTGDLKYLDWIGHYGRIVQVCGGVREKEAIARLKELAGLAGLAEARQ